jgi:hypothetical protein
MTFSPIYYDGNSGIKCPKCHKLTVYYNADSHLFCRNCKIYVKESELNLIRDGEQDQNIISKIAQWFSNLNKEPDSSIN